LPYAPLAFLRVAALLPGGKLDVLRGLCAQGTHVFMMGDDLNDAPALAEADAGWPWA